jgi:hypothetical protein
VPRHPPVRPPRKPNKSIKELEKVLDDINTGEGAAVRLTAYVGRYPEYLDRDRDIILLNIYSMLKKLTNEDYNR